MELRTPTSTNGEHLCNILTKMYVHESLIPSQPPLFVCLSPVSFPFCPHLFLPLSPLLLPMHPLLLQPCNEGADWDGENLCGGAAVCFAGNVLTEWPWNNWSMFCFPSSHLPHSCDIVDDLWMHSFWIPHSHLSFHTVVYNVMVSQSLITFFLMFSVQPLIETAT